MKKVNLNRRSVIAGMTASALAMPVVLRHGLAGAQGAPIKIGLVTPKTGPLAFFGAPDDFIIQSYADLFSKGVETSDGRRPIEVLVRDSQSSSSRASDVAADLILRDEVSLLLSAGGPDTVNPVADQAEINGVPSLSTASPWQPFIMGRGSNPKEGFDYTYLFGFGIEDAIAAYLSIFNSIDTNKKVGVLFPNDADGNAWGSEEFGFPPALRAAGFEVVDPGFFQPLSDDFSAQINAFKSAGVDIVMGTMIPPDFLSFWGQAAQQGFKPKVATIGKSLLLPNVPKVLGAGGNGLTTELAWHPSFPFQSASTGQSGADIVKAWQAQSDAPWVQTIGLKHALFDLAYDVLGRAGKPEDADAVVAAIKDKPIETTIGVADWGKSPIANVCKSQVLGGQWVLKEENFTLEVISSPDGSPVKPTAKMIAL